MSAATLKKPLPLSIFAGVFIVIWLIAAAFPFAWTVWGSFKVEADFFSRLSWWNAISGPITQEKTGGSFTGAGYYGAWVTDSFWHSVLNTILVTVFVTIVALTFRAMPHITLVSGYLLPVFQLNIWGYLPTAIIVLVAINQPFTLWMLHSFFLSIPKDLDESAMVDGCTRFEAFRRVVIPVMWPGVITTGLFSFLLGYNDFAVTAMLLSQDNQTMIPKIQSFMSSIYQSGNVMYAVAAVVSATVPLFILVLFFQRQIVSGLTAGAVKG